MKDHIGHIRANDRVTILAPNGIGLNGREYKERTGRVNPLLIFPTHVVLNIGTFGMVADNRNIVRCDGCKREVKNV